MINGKLIEARHERLLKDGDTIQFGVPKQTTATAEFIFSFYKALKIRRIQNLKTEKSAVSEKNNEVQSSKVARNITKKRVFLCL